MTNELLAQPQLLTRRYLLGLGAALGASPLLAEQLTAEAELRKAIAELSARWITPAEQFGTVERGNPLPYTHPPEKLVAVGLTRESWRLEVIAEADSNSKLERPLTQEGGTAFTFAELMKLAETRATRYLKMITCNNISAPLGLGLWEGVPLRDVIWLAKPTANVRHVFYYGYHNDDPKQRFACWLPINRVLEDPPGELPVLLCYKLNGAWLSGKRGGPVRIIVPESHGFKSVKWITHVVLTNKHQSDDTYAGGNNDTNSWLKTAAGFLTLPAKAKASQPFVVTGLAQVGISGLRKVQVWLRTENPPWPTDDPHFTKGAWRDADLLPLDAKWDALMPGASTTTALQFDPTTGQPRQWPLRYTLAHWATVIPGVTAGRYELRCRTIDANGSAQPMPRPFQKSGQNAIQVKSIVVE